MISSQCNCTVTKINMMRKQPQLNAPVTNCVCLFVCLCRLNEFTYGISLQIIQCNRPGGTLVMVPP